MEKTQRAINEIEVVDLEIITPNTNNMSTSKNIAELSEAELVAALANKRKTREQEQEKARKAFDHDNDAFCKATVEKFTQFSKELKDLKNDTIIGANALYNKMFELNGKEAKKVKSFTRKSTDGRIVVTVDYQERIEFTDEAIVHIDAIREIFKSKFESRNKGLYNILDGLLIKGTKGDYDPKLLAKARKQVRELGDENLIAEFDKLDDCQRVYGTSKYCRVKMKDANDKWQDINVQFSSL
ncbi:DUF3164 family protein [Tenacibaculum maritimum]|nr:DUF3164 family protein [Tenacibaculum maritimum]MDB0612187.1 DUF3164 family protein [Tenacibaculum maritimum]